MPLILNLTDMETGMKGFRRDRIVELTLSADRSRSNLRSPRKLRERGGGFMRSPSPTRDVR